jgi:hypothetical protein
MRNLTLLESLGVVPDIREPFMLADGRTVETGIGYATIRVGDRTVIAVR